MEPENTDTKAKSTSSTVVQYQSTSANSTTSAEDQHVTMFSSTQSTEVKEVSTSAYSGITKLTSTTFNDWKLRLTTVLGAQRLAKYILRDITSPVDNKLLDDHETFSLKALAAIRATIDSENFEVIQTTSCPQTAFLMLRKHHNNTGGLSKANLFSELVTMRLTSEGCLKDHLH